jgi:hypothetical protein
MRRLLLVCLGWGCVWLGAPALTHAVDPPQIERTIRKEPVYKTKTPRYCLLALGPKAESRVWIVLDGDAYYIDRKGNGDLTGPTDRGVPIEHKTKETGDDGQVFFKSPLFEEEVMDRGRRRRFDVSFEYSADYREAACNVVVREGKLPRICFAVLADRPQQAEVLYLDGPLSLLLEDVDGPPLVRGKEPKDLCVCVGTFGPKSSALVQNKAVPADAHPVAQIEFPSKRPGGKPISVKVILNRRC